jgi:hypothetical protein
MRPSMELLVALPPKMGILFRSAVPRGCDRSTMSAQFHRPVTVASNGLTSSGTGWLASHHACASWALTSRTAHWRASTLSSTHLPSSSRRVGSSKPPFNAMFGVPRFWASTLMCASGVWNSPVMVAATMEMSFGILSRTTISL